MNREEPFIERMCEEHPRLAEVLLTLFFLVAMGAAGWVDGPLVGVTQ